MKSVLPSTQEWASTAGNTERRSGSGCFSYGGIRFSNEACSDERCPGKFERNVEHGACRLERGRRCVAEGQSRNQPRAARRGRTVHPRRARPHSAARDCSASSWLRVVAAEPTKTSAHATREGSAGAAG